VRVDAVDAVQFQNDPVAVYSVRLDQDTARSSKASTADLEYAPIM
jgi:hypothetical protein